MRVGKVMRDTSEERETRKPSKQEYEQSEYHYELTGESPEWDPSSPSFSKQESSLLDSRGLVVESITSDHHKRMDELRRIFQLRSIAQDKEATLAEALQHRRREIASVNVLGGFRYFDIQLVRQGGLVGQAVRFRNTLCLTW